MLRCTLGALVALIALTAVDAASAQLATTRLTTDLERPTYVTQAPGDDDRLFILEKRGRIRVYLNSTGELLATPFLDIDALVGGGTSNNAETGLLGLAFHPDYETNGFFYVNYTSTGLDTVVRRYTVSADPSVADAGSGLTVLIIEQPQSNHNGGWMDFGPNDGYLYIATGDGGNFCDIGAGHSVGGNAQDITDNLLGKLLRIDIDSDDFPAEPFRNYGIPNDNPFVLAAGDDEIFCYGLRNPFRCAFDRANGDLFIGDVGQDAREEVSFIAAGDTTGPNFGWNCMEGSGCSSASGCGSGGCTCNGASLEMPIFDYTHNPPLPPAGFVCSVIGGYVYRGCALPELDGTYFFADFCGNQVWSFEFNGYVGPETTRTPELSPSIEGFTVNQVVSFGEDNAGEIYIVDQGSGGGSGQIFKVIRDPATVCAGDADGNGEVNITDLNLVLSNWQSMPACGTNGDVNADGNVDLDDLNLVLANWNLVCN